MSSGKRVLITGGTTGIGLAIADEKMLLPDDIAKCVQLVLDCRRGATS